MTDNGNIKKIAGIVEEAVTYPIPVQLVNDYGSGNRGGEKSNLSGSGSPTSVAQGAMRDLLGWRYRKDDPKGFLAALNKAIDLNEVEGYAEWAWKARPFMAQADLGEVTGAQASIYTRAKAALEQALPLLDKLKPLRADADEEEMESIRALVRSAWLELVNELGVVAGPRIHRIDGYFLQLLGDIASNSPIKYPDDVTSQDKLEKLGTLGKLALRFGFQRDRVLTVNEEQNLTDWLILLDHTVSLCQTWTNQKEFFKWNGSSTNKFLGTQLIRLSQALAVLGESVRETYAMMDSVFFGAEERNVTVLTFSLPDNSNPPQSVSLEMSVSELLSWVEHFAVIEGPQLIEDSGKDGVAVVSETLNRFKILLGQLLDQLTTGENK